MIRLKNVRKRMFYCELRSKPTENERTQRIVEDKKTGIRGVKYHKYTRYENLSIYPKSVSKPLEEEILNNPSIKGAIANKWLKIIKILDE